MNTTRTAIVVFALLVLGACANPLTKNIEVESQASANADFGAISSYQWLASAQILNDPRGQWEPRGLDGDAEIRFLINRELRARNITEVASDPDVFVAYVAGVDMAALDWEKDPKTELKVLTEHAEGAIAVVLVDARTGDPIWGAIASDRVEGQSSVEDTRTRLDYAVSRMFRQLPQS